MHISERVIGMLKLLQTSNIDLSDLKISCKCKNNSNLLALNFFSDKGLVQRASVPLIAVLFILLSSLASNLKRLHEFYHVW